MTFSMDSSEVLNRGSQTSCQGGEVWLLITTGAAFNQNVAASLVSTKLVETGFDRVYLLDHNEQCTARLK
jgi:hypothetical protein